MRATYSLVKREFTAYFLSPIAYVALMAFLAVTGLLFFTVAHLLTETGPRGVEYPMQALLGSDKFWLVFLFIPPLLTMRLFAEERSSGTLEMLLTAPIRDWQVVFAKFDACFKFYFVMWLPTLLYLPVLLNWDWDAMRPRIDYWPVVTSYIGVFLAGAMFIALGLLVSSLVKSQMVAALLSLLLGLVFIVPGFLVADMDSASPLYRAAYFISVPMHFHQDFTRGIVDSREVILYVSVTLFCLFLTVRSLESRRWK